MILGGKLPGKVGRRRLFSIRPVGQAVKTSPFHGGNMGSIPVRVTKNIRAAQAVRIFFYKYYAAVVELADTQDSRPNPANAKRSVGRAAVGPMRKPARESEPKAKLERHAGGRIKELIEYMRLWWNWQTRRI